MLAGRLIRWRIDIAGGVPMTRSGSAQPLRREDV